MFRALLCGALLVLAAPAVADQAKVKIHPVVWADFQKYLQNIGGARNGAYAVTTDGMGAMGTICRETKCKPTIYTKRAVDGCEEANPGLKCIVFAEDREIQVDYEVGE